MNDKQKPKNRDTSTVVDKTDTNQNTLPGIKPDNSLQPVYDLTTLEVSTQRVFDDLERESRSKMGFIQNMIHKQEIGKLKRVYYKNIVGMELRSVSDVYEKTLAAESEIAMKEVHKMLCPINHDITLQINKMNQEMNADTNKQHTELRIKSYNDHQEIVCRLDRCLAAGEIDQEIYDQEISISALQLEGSLNQIDEAIKNSRHLPYPYVHDIETPTST